jgi:hypothetical protein
MVYKRRAESPRFPLSALSLRNRALRSRPSIFLGLCWLQRRDDVDQVVSLLFVYLALPCPSILIGLGDDSLCFAQLCLMSIEEARIRAKMSAVQTRIRMRTMVALGRNPFLVEKMAQGAAQRTENESAR